MEIDNRGSHYWVARYWAEELAAQGADPTLQASRTDAPESNVSAALEAVSGERFRGVHADGQAYASH